MVFFLAVCLSRKFVLFFSWVWFGFVVVSSSKHNPKEEEQEEQEEEMKCKRDLIW
jgi:hypothetical protein